MVRMQWWAYLLMLMVYICYLLIGAAVFQKLESPFEEKRCMNAKAKVKDKKEEFGNEVCLKKKLAYSKNRTRDLRVTFSQNYELFSFGWLRVRK